MRATSTLDAAYSRLNETIRVLRATSISLLGSTLIEFVICGLLIWSSLNHQLNRSDSDSAFSAVGLFVLIAVGAAATHDYFTRQASNTQSFVADVIQNVIRESSSSTSSTEIQSEEIELKHKLRALNSAMDLPLVPGRFGALVYIIINLIIAVYALWSVFNETHRIVT